jgi:hypothetical protein
LDNPKEISKLFLSDESKLLMESTSNAISSKNDNESSNIEKY